MFPSDIHIHIHTFIPVPPSGGAFAAIVGTERRVVAWGDYMAGGDCEEVQEQLWKARNGGRPGAGNVGLGR